MCSMSMLDSRVRQLAGTNVGRITKDTSDNLFNVAFEGAVKVNIRLCAVNEPGCSSTDYGQRGRYSLGQLGQEEQLK